MKTRRHLLILLGATALAPRVVFAQSKRAPILIGWLHADSRESGGHYLTAFKEGLAALGWKEGSQVVIDERWAYGRRERLPELAADLVRLNVDVIVATSSPTALAAQKATTAIPIVLAAVADPVASGLVESLARPGGNITGLTAMSPELAGKLLELLKEMVPKLSRVAVLWNPQGAASQLNWKEIQLPARQLGVQLHSLEVRSPDDFDKAFEDASRARAGALFIMPDALIFANLKRIASLAAKSRLPSIFQWSEFADAGGLMAYGANRLELYRRAATFVDKILKGAKPGDLPVEQATKFELVVNMKTTKALGITIPQSVRIRADRVIE